jgi:hypothetical protein
MKWLTLDRSFILAGMFLLLFSLGVSAQTSRPRTVNPKTGDVATMVMVPAPVRADSTNRRRAVKRSHRKKAVPKAATKIGKAKTSVKHKSNAPTKTKKKEGNLKSMATTKKPAAKKAAAKKPAAKKPAAKKPAAKKAAPKKAAAAKKPAAKKAAPKKAAAKKPAAKKAAPKKAAAKKPAAKKAAPKKAAAKKK